MNLCPNFLWSHAGDYYANTEIAAMKEQFPDMEFIMVDSRWASLVANARVLLLNAVSRIPGVNWGWRILRPVFYLRYAAYLPKSYLRASRPDVIYAFGAFPRVKADRVPVVGVEYFSSDRHLGMTGFSHMKALEVQAKRRSDARVTSLITITPGSKARLEELIPETREKLVYVPLYMPYVEPSDPARVAAKHAERGRIRVLFVGATAIRKGLPQLLEAFRLLDPDTRNSLELTVVSKFSDGKVPGIAEYAQVLNNLPTEKLHQLMREAHIFALPTQTDTYGRVIIEAMAAGCAVITSNADPQDWMLDYGRTGIGVDPDSPAAIAAALTKLAGDAALRADYGAAALTRFTEVFHHRVVAVQLRRIFEEAIAKAA